MVTHRVIRVGPGRVSAFPRTNQGHVLGKVRLREAESSSAFTANRNLFLTIQHGDCSIQNGVRRVLRYVVDASAVVVHTTARYSLSALAQAVVFCVASLMRSEKYVCL